MSPENAKIFQTDDDKGWFRTLKGYLKKSGHSIVISATTTEEAMSKIHLSKEQGASVAILDNKMPKDGDGEIVANALREAIPGIVIISLCVQLQRPKWADYHFDKGEFSYQTATQTLPDLIRSF